MTRTVNVLSLFSGIGALDLGLRRAGMNIVGQIESDPYCQQILDHHFPEAAKHDDVRTAVEWWGGAVRPAVDLVAGGPPCQPFSGSGRRRGVSDPRWMWPAMADVVRAVRPRYVLLENVIGLVRDRVAFGWILGDLAELGFDAEWSVLSACSFGAPHTRERLFLLAYPNSLDGPPWLGSGSEGAGPLQGVDEAARTWADRVDWAVASAGADGRDVDGLAAQMVAAGGNAVAVPVGEYVGRLIMASAEGVS